MYASLLAHDDRKLSLHPAFAMVTSMVARDRPKIETCPRLPCRMIRRESSLSLADPTERNDRYCHGLASARETFNWTGLSPGGTTEVWVRPSFFVLIIYAEIDAGFSQSNSAPCQAFLTERDPYTKTVQPRRPARTFTDNREFAS